MTYLLIALAIALITAFIIFIIIDYNKLKNAINNEIATILKKIGEKKFKNYDFNDKVYKSLYNELKEEISPYRKLCPQNTKSILKLPLITKLKKLLLDIMNKINKLRKSKNKFILNE